MFCKVTQLESGYVWFWSKDKLINRKFAMEEMYQKFQNNEEWNLSDECDPFTEPPETECLIGATQVYLKSLAYMVSFTTLCIVCIACVLCICHVVCVCARGNCQF